MSYASKDAVPNAAEAAQQQQHVHNAALLGASLAFSKPPVPSPSRPDKYSGGSNGALLAAKRVASPSQVRETRTEGSSKGGRPLALPLQSTSRSSSSSTLGLSSYHLDQVTSPSNIAARLAAARYSPLRPAEQPVGTHNFQVRDNDDRNALPPSGSVSNALARYESRRSYEQPCKTRGSFRSQQATSLTEGRQAYDRSVNMSAQMNTLPAGAIQTKQTVNHPDRPITPLKIAQSSPPPLRSPKPQRAFKIPQEPKDKVSQQNLETTTLKCSSKQQTRSSPVDVLGGAKSPNVSKSQKLASKSPLIKEKPVRLSSLKIDTATSPQLFSRKPTLPGSISQDVSRPMSRQREGSTVESYGSVESPVSFKSAKEVQEEDSQWRGKSKPRVPPPRRSNTRVPDARSFLESSHQLADRLDVSTPVPIQGRHQSQAPPLTYTPERFSPPLLPSYTSVYHNRYQRESLQRITKHMTGETLSSAIMGAALASSSRNVSPASRPLPIEPLFPARKQHHHHSPFHRSPSPLKQSPPKRGKLRTTLRKEPDSSDEEDEVHEYKKKGTRIMGMKGRKHPNKHHEGTRRRWRDQITERERKRYEGVWAANKGTFVYVPSNYSAHDASGNLPSYDVVNLGVQEIWMRSRLPTHVLEEVWDLVDSRGVGRLSRTEFVVGLWLIDQRLKGRKLPIKVSDSIWASATSVGLKVKSFE